MIDWANQQIRDVDGVQDILDRWAETNQHLLAFERDTGWLSKERYDELAERTAYIPLFMPMEDVLERRGEMPAFPMRHGGIRDAKQQMACGFYGKNPRKGPQAYKT